MKNPLYKRLPRELRAEFGKYLVVFLMMVLTIGEISGFLVADESMITAYNNSFTDYNIEDGNFALQKEASPEVRRQIEDLGIVIYDLFYVDRPLTNESTLRIFQNRSEVDLACVMAGRLAETPGEIAIDRMYADNNHLSVGDTVSDGENTWEIVGLVALSDYSTMFESNTDSMFDSVKFGVAVVSEEEFSGYDDRRKIWNYAWKYNDAPADEKEEQEASTQLMKDIYAISALDSFVPRYQNQAIRFTGEDMGSDRAMVTVFLYILMAVIAFVFAITIRNTIAKEANVIGTLRASGYTRGELLRHYMALPVIVTLFSALIGNILGYTFFKNINANLYYSSYSLPTYVTLWSPQAFLETTLVPIVLMLIINFVMLHRKIGLEPIKLLRRDLRRNRNKNALRLNPGIPFFSRFRLRVLFQNAGNYVMMAIGILLANLLLMFGLLFPSLLTHYQDTVGDHLIANYQYILRVPMEIMATDTSFGSVLNMLYFFSQVETENETAEKFSVYSLQTLPQGSYQGEELLLYGVAKDSRYLSLELPEDTVAVSSAYADKLHVSVGEEITLKEKYTDDTYAFTVGEIYDYESSLAVFMEQSVLNRTFGLFDDYFSGYFSDTEITDIDESYISTVIDLEAVTKISRQLLVSMGSVMNIFAAASVILFMILIYLLSKLIIEKNAQSISMAKILGYRSGEISRLYLQPTTVLIIVLLLLSLPVETLFMKLIFEYYLMTEISGWIPLYFDPMMYVKMIVLGIGTYAVVALLEYRKIRKIPMDEALKNVE